MRSSLEGSTWRDWLEARRDRPAGVGLVSHAMATGGPRTAYVEAVGW